jgi:hypothetical protein
MPFQVTSTLVTVQELDGIWNGLSMELHMESTGVGIYDLLDTCYVR